MPFKRLKEQAHERTQYKTTEALLFDSFNISLTKDTLQILEEEGFELRENNEHIFYKDEYPFILDRLLGWTLIDEPVIVQIVDKKIGIWSTNSWDPEIKELTWDTEEDFI